METEVESLEGAPRRSRLAAWASELRPDQWIKNLVVYAGAVFGLRLFDPTSVLISTVVFVLFCALSSAVYLLNDVLDRERDAEHPTKRLRPIAAGEIGVPAAVGVSLVLAAAGLGTAARLGPAVLVFSLAYVGLNVAYSLALKHVAIVDVLSISIGFVLRAVVGAAAIGVAISPWLVLCTFLGMLFVALAKRRAEIANVESVAASRPVSRGYTLEFLDQLMSILVAATIVAYCIYTLSPDVREKFGVDHLYATAPFVVYGVFRYLWLVRFTRVAENPARAAVTDGPLVVTVLLWAATVTALLYLGPTA